MADVDAVKCKAIDSSVLTTSTDEGDCINIIDSNGRQNSGEPDPTDSGYNSTPDETRKWYKLVEPQIVRIEEKKGAILPEPPDSGYSSGSTGSIKSADGDEAPVEKKTAKPSKQAKSEKTDLIPELKYLSISNSDLSQELVQKARVHEASQSVPKRAV